MSKDKETEENSATSDMEKEALFAKALSRWMLYVASSDGDG